MGRIVMTRNFILQAAAYRADGSAVRVAAIIKRHITGDWGYLDPEGEALNNASLGNSVDGAGRLMLVYAEEFGFKVWVIIE